MTTMTAMICPGCQGALPDEARVCPHCGRPRQAFAGGALGPSGSALSPGVLASVRALSVKLPGGAVIVRETDVEVRAGEVVALLGPSGSGKTTVLRALLSPEELRSRGYEVQWAAREVHGDWALVPQRGALLDHLDVAGNIALAQAANQLPVDPSPWLDAVELDVSFGASGRAVGTLSGGQAQRVAVARVLAAGRKLLVLDEPSIGLDPAGVRALARLLLRQARAQGVGVLVITHDLALAGGAADRVLFLDTVKQHLLPVEHATWQGPAELLPGAERASRLAGLETSVEALLHAARAVTPSGKGGPLAPGGPGALRVAGASLLRALDPRLFRQSLTVGWRAARQAFLRPLPFYAVVGLLMGVTVPYVVANLSTDLTASAMLRIVGGTYVLSLAPPLSAILFVATSGNAVSAWLGGLQLNRQVQALEGLGIAPSRYLWAPAWVAMTLSYLGTAVLFTTAMLLGGWALFEYYGVSHALSVITSDFLDPAPSRLPFLVRGIWLVVLYAFSMAAIVVSRGVGPKDTADQVTSAMTSAVVRTTLFVVFSELASIAAVFSWTRGR